MSKQIYDLIGLFILMLPMNLYMILRFMEVLAINHEKPATIEWNWNVSGEHQRIEEAPLPDGTHCWRYPDAAVITCILKDE